MEPTVYQIQPQVSKISEKALRIAWTEFLGQWQWMWFCTMTFRDVVHPEAANKTFKYFISKLNRSLYGPRWFKRAGGGVPWCRGLEFQRRGVIHYHALLGSVQDARPWVWMQKWDRLAGYSRIELIEDSWRARRYISKYVMKHGNVEVGGALTKPERALLDQIPFRLPAQRKLDFKTNADAGVQ